MIEPNHALHDGPLSETQPPVWCGVRRLFKLIFAKQSVGGRREQPHAQNVTPRLERRGFQFEWKVMIPRQPVIKPRGGLLIRDFHRPERDALSLLIPAGRPRSPGPGPTMPRTCWSWISAWPRRFRPIPAR